MGGWVMLALLSLLGSFTLCAQEPGASAATALLTNIPALTSLASGTTNEESLAAVELAMTNAFQRVLQIVNRPVRAYARTRNLTVATFSPGWFHAGAIKPDFNTVDVRQTQELNYAKSKYVTSDLTPGLVFLGQDLEFNAMTKYFYVNRSLPKRRLTEAEMLEINQLYRIIGRCESEIARRHSPAASAPAQSTAAAETVEPPPPAQPLERLRAIPRSTRVLYGGIAIGALGLVLVLLRLVKKTH